MEIEQPTLFNHGILNEQSDIRAHVCVLALTVYAFPTIEGVRAIERGIENNWLKPKKAWQPGVEYATADGYPVPWHEIRFIKRIPVDLEDLKEFSLLLPTEEKGKLAVNVVQNCLKNGRFPLFANGEVVNDVDMQIKGMDIYVRGNWKIQVKCDFKGGGDGKDGTTGNLYLQTHELNPLKKH